MDFPDHLIHNFVTNQAITFVILPSLFLYFSYGDLKLNISLSTKHIISAITFKYVSSDSPCCLRVQAGTGGH